MPEKRKHSRKNVFLDAELSYPNSDKICTEILNISMGGVYMQAHDTQIPTVGELVNITFLVDVDGESEHTFPSKVVRIDDCGDGFGIALMLIKVNMRYFVLLERIMEKMIEEYYVA